MTVADPSLDLQLIALDHVYGGPRRSPLGSKPNRLVLTIIGIQLVLTTFLASHLNLWIDEAHALATTNHDLPTTLQWAIGFEHKAPLYFILLWLTRHIHDSLLIARLPSLLAIAATLWLSSRISQKLFPMVHRGWLVLALAFNPLLIAIALNARGDAWTVFLSTTLLWLFIKAYAYALLDPTPSQLISRPFIPQQNQAWARWAYGATAILALYSHTFLAFQIVAQGLVLFLIALISIEHRKRAIAYFGNYCLDSIVITIFSLPLVLLLGQQLTVLEDYLSLTNSPNAIATIPAAVGQTLQSNLAYLLPGNPDAPPSGQRQLGRLFIALWLAALAWGRRRQTRFNVTLTWLIHGFVALQLIVALALVPNSPALDYPPSILVASFVYLSVLGLISLLPRTRRRLLLSLSLILLLCFNTSSLWQLYSPMAKPGDYARVGEYLQEFVEAQEPVLVLNGEVALALAHYYPAPEVAPSPNQATENQPESSANDLIPLPRSLFSPESSSIPKYGPNDLIITSRQQIEQAFSPSATTQEQSSTPQPHTPDSLIDAFDTATAKSQKQPIPIIDPAQARLEVQIRLMDLSPEAKAQVREAMELPPLEDQPQQSSPPSSVEAFLDGLTSQTFSQTSDGPELFPSLWLVRDDGALKQTDFAESDRLLNEFLMQHYRLLTGRQFHGTKVQQWQRLPAEFASITES